MKHILLILGLLIATRCYSQIPNNGFENWSTFGSYEDPQYWGSTNYASTGSFYAITKSSDHYPVSVGSYSVRIENNILLNPSFGARGYLATGNPPPAPDFKIIGHPGKLTGYYKFQPQNGDTMYIHVQLFFNGNTVSYGDFKTSTASSGWKSFIINLPVYTNADSGSIFIAAYHADGFNYMPHGNSILYVDNINFDELITDVGTIKQNPPAFEIFPVPANEYVTINNQSSMKINHRLNIYDIYGRLIKTEIRNENEYTIDISNLSKGIYIFEIESKERLEKHKITIF